MRRLTESRIPGGFTLENAKKLGESGQSGAFILVSKYPSPVRMGHELPLRIRCVLFHAADLPNSSYAWTLEVLNDQGFSQEIHAEETSVGLSPESWESSGFSADIVDEDIRHALSLGGTTIRVTVEVEGTSVVLDQPLQQPRTDVELAFQGMTKEQYAHLGTPELTRRLANAYGPLFTEPSIAKRLAASLLYQAHPRADSTEDYAFALHTDSAKTHSPEVGILRLPPAIVATVAKLDGDDPQRGWGKPKQLGYIRQLDKKYGEVETSEQVDYFNLLRFPRSAIQLATKVVARGLEPASARRHDALFRLFGALVSLKAMKKFKGGKSGGVKLKGKRLSGYRLYKAARRRSLGGATLYRAPEVDQLFQDHTAIFRVKIWDVRSGEPIANTPIRHLRLRSVDALGNELVTAAVAFPDDADATELGDVLEQLGYARLAGASDFSIPLVRYWYDRGVDAPNDAPTNGKFTDPVLQEYRAHRQTDGTGVLNVRVPWQMMQDRKVILEVGLRYMPMTLEATDAAAANGIRRPEQGPTGFDVRWEPDDPVGRVQEIDVERNMSASEADPSIIPRLSNPFGWRVHDPTTGRTGTLYTAIRVPLKPDVGPPDSSSYDDRLSRSGIHLNVLAMEWCQPVWNDLNDPPPGRVRNFSNKVYWIGAGYDTLTQGDYSERLLHQRSGRHMHLVSATTLLSKNPLRNKGYGSFHRPAPQPETVAARKGKHLGVDLYNVARGPVFAVHGGVARLRTSGGAFEGFRVANRGTGLGYYMELVPSSTSNMRFLYAHLGDSSTVNSPVPEKFRMRDGALVAIPSAGDAITDPAIVVAGEILGYAGRTGNIRRFEPLHTHFITQYSDQNSRIHKVETLRAVPVGIRGVVDDSNTAILPSNMLPLVFPCKLSFGANSQRDECTFHNGANQIVVVTHENGSTFEVSGPIRKFCWAPQELVCPHMNDQALLPPDQTSNTEFVATVQAQLRFKFLVDNQSGYVDPGPVDGSFGNPPVPTAMGLSNGDAVTVLRRRSSGLVQVRHQAQPEPIVGWVPEILLANQQAAVTTVTTITTDITQLLQNQVERTAYAIFVFRHVNANILPDLVGMFQFDQNSLTVLNTAATIHPPQGG